MCGLLGATYGNRVGEEVRCCEKAYEEKRGREEGFTRDIVMTRSYGSNLVSSTGEATQRM
jgi:hypothetical protein